MDVDEFLDKELQLETKEEVEETPTEPKTSKDDVIKHYFELWNKLSEIKFKWDSDLYAELNEATNDVKEELSKLLPRTKRDKNTIKQLIARATMELENKNYEAATKLFSEISGLRNKFPKFLLEEKKEINKEIFLLYEKLHDQIDIKYISDLRRSIAEAENLIRSSYSNLDSSNIDEAKMFYEKAISIYKQLPHGFLQKKIELGTELLRLYKDLSIHAQIKNLEQQLHSRLTARHKNISQDLRRLSEIAPHRDLKPEKISTIESLRAISKGKHSTNKTLLNKLISRKLERAKINLKKKNYLEVRKNIDSILKVDPNNAEAKKIMDKIAVKH